MVNIEYFIIVLYRLQEYTYIGSEKYLGNISEYQDQYFIIVLLRCLVSVVGSTLVSFYCASLFYKLCTSNMHLSCNQKAFINFK